MGMGRGSGENERRRPRRDRLLRERRHDPYEEREKPPEPTRCPDCGAVFRNGRWSWAALPGIGADHLCPACRRTRDELPAGIVTLSGSFLADHRDEILRLVDHIESREKTGHPLKRIMAVREEDDVTVITTTDLHLARQIGDSLRSAYQGRLIYSYPPGADVLRVSWQR